MTSRKFKRFRRLQSFIGFILLFFLLGMSFAYAMFQGGFVSWFIFYSFLPFALYSLFLLAYPLQAFKVKRIISSRTLKAGETITIEMILNRKFPFPLLFLVVEDIVPATIHADRHKQIIFPGFKRNIKLKYPMKVSRGEHTWQGFRLMTGDILGILKKERWQDNQQTILVYPPFEELIYKPLERRFEHGGAVNPMQFQKDTSLVSGVRQYQPGDRFSWIDWKASARTNAMMSKEFEVRRTNDLMIVLDRMNSVHFETAVQFAASLVKTILQHGGQVGFFSAGKEVTYIPIRGEDAQEKEIFLHLAKVIPDSTTHLVNRMTKEFSLYKQPAVVVVITTSIDMPLLDGLNGEQRRKGGIVVYNIKKRGTPVSQEEVQYSSLANQRGIVVKTLYEGQFRSAFLEVLQA
ncbi:DUF58 domain-containing protein [Lederbergia sp. NSJ-179]|uniref:DUF58 domain-containing protein n=1 Tax=Lederbergia sp. NSJ-179 TaxID=2931402 RepID=UPI001FD25F86|nr:DUF58 domain-containing protein [Lederbergia sp. NSJ-179]MCJ7842644.1 DUF58 domain-containing protein [Lederbergia sp. NSJ-179]